MKISKEQLLDLRERSRAEHCCSTKAVELTNITETTSTHFADAESMPSLAIGPLDTGHLMDDDDGDDSQSMEPLPATMKLQLDAPDSVEDSVALCNLRDDAHSEHSLDRLV